MIESAAWLVRRPASAVARAELKPISIVLPYAEPSAVCRFRSLQRVQEGLNHLVGRRDHLGVRRIGLLGYDQLGELVGDVGVRSLERRAGDRARGADDRGPRFGGGLIGAAVQRLQVVGAVEMR